MNLSASLAIAGEIAGDWTSAVEEPTDAEIDAVLDLARAVAHAAERKAAPLATYALGRALAGASRDERVRILVEATRRIDAAATV